MTYQIIIIKNNLTKGKNIYKAIKQFPTGNERLNSKLTLKLVCFKTNLNK